MIPAKRLLGRTIVAFDPGTRRERNGPTSWRCHRPTLTLDDGTVLSFMAEELNSGDGYGVDIHASPKARGRS